MHMHYCIPASKNFQVILVSFPELTIRRGNKGGLSIHIRMYKQDHTANVNIETKI